MVAAKGETAAGAVVQPKRQTALKLWLELVQVCSWGGTQAAAGGWGAAAGRGLGGGGRILEHLVDERAQWAGDLPMSYAGAGTTDRRTQAQ